MSTERLSIVEATEASAATWNAFVEAHPHGSTFHRWEWREVYREVYGHEAPYLAAYAGGELRGVLPLVRVKSFIFGHYLVSLPFVSYGGPLGDGPAQRALTARAAELGHGAKLTELRSRVPLDTALTPV
ncbi:MAG: hypothetical protein ACOVSI_10660, partial [Gemmatimonas sp.]